MKSCQLQAMSSIEQADAEEHMSEWLAAAQVENAYMIGPALVEMGFEVEQLQCAKEYFKPAEFSDALNWLGALVSSMEQVCGIEESIGRVSELVHAVKKFAYDERSDARELNVHDSLQSTLTILGHKLRIKQIKVEKRFNASPATIETQGRGAEPGVDQPDRQRGRCLAGERKNRDCDVDRAGVAGGMHWRSRRGNPRGSAATYLQAVLHHQAAGLGHGIGTGYCAPHRDEKVWRADRCGVEAGRYAIYGEAAADGRGRKDWGVGSRE